jgi:hypothetical protein
MIRSSQIASRVTTHTLPLKTDFNTLDPICLPREQAGRGKRPKKEIINLRGKMVHFYTARLVQFSIDICTFFDELKVLTKYVLFSSWTELFDHILASFKPKPRGKPKLQKP